MDNYKKAVQIMAGGDKDEIDRGDIIIKEMCRLTNDILDYRYAVNHYEGNQKGIFKDKIGSIKNTLAVMLGDIDMYMEYLDITDKVEKKKTDRLIKLASKKDKGVV